MLCEALAGADPALNPTVVQDGQHYYTVLPDGQRVRLCNSLEHHKFALACSCGKGHVRYSTLNSVRQERDLYCQFCHSSKALWRDAKKGKVFPSEKTAMRALKSVGLDKEVACEVSLPFWWGRVDFYHVATKTMMQADGKQRYVKAAAKLPGKQLQLDLQCCIDAWKAGVRMLRVHTDCTIWAGVMQKAVQLKGDKFIMLTAEYDTVQASATGSNCIAWLKHVLQDAQYKRDDSTGCHIFYP
jgi:hypothetical protein